MGGARATAWRDTLEGSDLTAEQRIVREAVQNSVDATIPRKKTEIFVWDKTISGDEADAFRNILALDSSDSPIGRLAKLDLPRDNSFAKLANGEPTHVTIIEDHNTCGLGFDEKTSKDRFKELCLYLGQDTTDVESERGGSYGFGKTVYQASSDCRTFLVYSVFEPKPETQDVHARLFGCSSFIGHRTEEGNEYTGRAWFGVPDDKSGIQTCGPLVNEMAHDLAASLGFMRRNPQDFGTAIMILGSDLHLGNFREAVEDYWWPRIISDKLSIELWEENDNVLPPPEPLSRPELRPYIRCYQLVENNDLPIGTDEFKYPLNKVQGRSRGALALGVLPPISEESEDDPDQDTRLRDTVALIRSGPRMVVQYMDTGGKQRSGFAGTFVSHADAEHALHLSEPPSHDSWNARVSRLSADPTSIKLVEGILRTIKQQARRFQSRLNPAIEPPTVPGTRRLEQLLADVMSSKGLGIRTPPRIGKDPFEIRIHETRRDIGVESAIVAKVEVKLKDDAPLAQIAARLSLQPVVLLDDNERREQAEHLGLASVSIGGVPGIVSNDSRVDLQLTKDNMVVVEVESNPYERGSSAELEVSVELIETAVDAILSESTE